jgi:penicillin-binding protein 1C
VVKATQEWLKERKRIITILLIGSLVYVFVVPVCSFSDPCSTVITDVRGQLLGARVATDGQWRFPPSDTLFEKVKKATLAFEDRYFYYHPGINPVSVFRAVISNIKAGRVVSGGSTLTMQTVRLYRKGKPRRIPEKIIEMIFSTRLELAKSKEEILAMYASQAPYGGNVVGIEAAAWRYFATSSDQLSWAEAATLAVLPNSPALVHPGKNRNILRIKRDRLLYKMNKLGWIDHTTLITSLAERIPDEPNPMPYSAPHLLNRVHQLTPEKYVRTTLDAAWQSSVSEIVEKHHNTLKSNQIHNLSAIIIEVETGDIKAYIGNCGYPYERNHANDVDVITAPRSTGSLLKPLLYAAMIDDGKLLPGSLITDIPINMGGFSPQNFDGSFQGAIPAKQALSRSLNVPAVQLLKQYGIQRFADLLKQLGMHTIGRPSEYYGLSLILGGAEGTLEEMTNMYASLSRVLNHYGMNGHYCSNDYRSPDFIDDRKKESCITSRQSGYLSASAIWSAYEAMREVNRPETELGWQHFGSSRKIAWKTGTSFGYRDGWAIGTNRQYVVGVWTGNADGEGRPGLTGIACAAPVLFEIFGILPESAWFLPPTDELVKAVVCRLSGYIAGQFCTDRDTLPIPLNGVKSSVCPFHRLVHLSDDEKFRVNSDCYPVARMKHISWFVLPPVPEWYYMKHHADYKRLPPFRPGCEQSGQRSMGLVYPREEVKIFIPRTLSGEKGRVVFEAVHSNPDATIYWHIDNRFIASTKFIHQIEVLPAPGKHQLILIDENGEELIKLFEAVEP